MGEVGPTGARRFHRKSRLKKLSVADRGVTVE
jgi:hypothetical protein